MKKKTYEIILGSLIACLCFCLTACIFSVSLDTPYPCVILMLLTFACSVAIMAIVSSTKDNYNWSIKNLNQAYIDHPQSIPDSEQDGEIGEFAKLVISQKVSIASVGLIKPQIIVDDVNKKFVYEKGTNLSKVYSFSDLINYEVYENGENVVNGVVGSPLGGLGVVGATIGSTCNILQLVLRINDVENPQISVFLLRGMGCDRKSGKYFRKKDNLQQVCSLLEYIINSNSHKRFENAQSQNNATEKSPREQLQELKGMLDSGLITQEDYEQKKKQILGL